MRKQLLGLLVPLTAFVMIAKAADMTGNGVAASAALQKLEVAHSQDGLRVEFRSKGALAPKVTTLDSPGRIVVDFPNTVMATGQSLINVGSDGVKDVRVGMDGQNPPSTRVVIDLAANRSDASQHELTAGSNGSFVLTIHDAVVAHRQAAPVVKPPVTKVAPVVAQASAPAVIVPAAAPLVAPVASRAATSDKPTDFAFVEPQYSVKDDNKTATPAVKAEEAASRFADKTAAELVATTTHAAMAQAADSSASPAPSNSEPIHPAVNLAAEQKVQLEQKQAASGAKYTGEPISVNLKDVDLKDFFRLIHEISGLNVVLDPMVHGTLTIVLDDVPWDQALDIVLKNNELSRQLDGNVLRIATVDTLKKEAEGRRAQVDAEALAVDKVSITRFLSYAHAKDVLLPVKKFLSQRGDVVADERTNSLIVSDIPSVLPQIDRIIQQMDRKTQEVEIEARVVAATRNFARDIGVQLGLGWGNGTTAIGGTQNVGTTPTAVGGVQPNYIVTTGGSSTTGFTIPLFSNLGATGPTSGLQLVNASSNVRVDLLLTMAESRGLLKVLSRPRVVTQNNIQAIVRQGVKVPVVTAAQLGGPATVTYVDAFLRLTVTPQITSEGTIFLNVDVENTLPDFGNAINGNPTLITQQATTQVLVTDGGTVVIGGVIQTQNSLSIAQVPLLGDIPYLGNLFKHRTVQTSNQELIFFITPRIVQT
jgi:type IV pilus assembly protein PilQ